MKTGKVKVTDLLGLGNIIFHSGDEVNEENFPEGNFDKLIAGGFIEEDKPKSNKPAANGGKKGGKKGGPVANTHTLSEADIEANPELVEEGLKAGDEIEFDAEVYQLDESGNLVKVK